MSATDVEKYRSLVEDSAKLSEVMRKNYSAVSEMMEKINSMQQISSDKIQQLSALANSVSQASNSLTDERTLTGLKHLEAIVKK
ncbi:MAG: hypothetical protein HKO83_00835 [Ignavibacteriaceae bacterium]|nr:hypothetical protein [Ignavibacteriaceae bacterium]